MMSRFLALALVGLSSTAANAQSNASVDSLIQHFVEVGPRSSWRPWMLFDGCPTLKSWQDYGFRRLAAMELSKERENELARSWMPVLRDCGDRRLEQWYLDRFAAALSRGDIEQMTGVWMTLRVVDSPSIRNFFRDLLHDPQQPARVRDVAGEMYLRRLTSEEQLREYLSLFAASLLPPGIAWSVPELLTVNGHGAALLDGVARLIAADARLANQPAFVQIVVSSTGRVDQHYRQRLADALEAGLASGRAMSDQDVDRLRATATHLRRSQR